MNSLLCVFRTSLPQQQSRFDRGVVSYNHRLPSRDLVPASGFSNRWPLLTMHHPCHFFHLDLEAPLSDEHKICTVYVDVDATFLAAHGPSIDAAMEKVRRALSSSYPSVLPQVYNHSSHPSVFLLSGP